jgi:hypothetical protein
MKTIKRVNACNSQQRTEFKRLLFQGFSLLLTMAIAYPVKAAASNIIDFRSQIVKKDKEETQGRKDTAIDSQFLYPFPKYLEVAAVNF